MSRLGKKPIPIPKDVKVRLSGDLLHVEGPNGELDQRIHPKVGIDITENALKVTVPDDTRESRSLHGLHAVLIKNMLTGVAKGFERALDIVGVGYRAELKGRTAVFNLGYSHPIHFELPEGIEANIEKTRIVLRGADKHMLGMTAAKIRGFRKPEPYKGKGVKYAEETIRRKAGKAGK